MTTLAVKDANSTTQTMATTARTADSAQMQNVDTLFQSAGGTDRSVSAGTTAAVLMAANANRRGFYIQNQGTGAIYINWLATATAANTSLLIPAGTMFKTTPDFVPTGAISIIAASASTAVNAVEW